MTSFVCVLATLVLIGRNEIEAVLTLRVEDIQPTIEEDTRIVTTVQSFTVDGIADGNDVNSVVCYVQHVLPQPNSDSLIGPFESVVVSKVRGDYAVIYDPDNGFQLNTLLNTFYQIRVCCYEVFPVVTPDPPVCSPLLITITKNIPPQLTGPTSVVINGDIDAGEFIAQLTFTDDPKDTVSLSLSSTPADASQYFNIDATGKLTAAVTGLQIPYGLITLQISATDGKDTSTVPLLVTVRDFNSRPDIVGLPNNITIKENAAPGTLLQLLRFSDPDGFLVRIEPVCTVNPTEESFKFTYDTFRNELRLSNITSQPLDFESRSFYNITCVITDGNLASTGEHLGVYVENVNEAPVFQEQSQTCQLYESPAGESFCDVRFHVTDPDNDAVTLSLAGNFSAQFALTDANTRITFAVDYDLEAISSPTSVILRAVAIDPLGATGTTIINVAVADVNDNDPVFTTEITTIPVGYGTSLGLIGTLTATDRDLGSNGDLLFESVNISPPDAATHFNLFNNGEIHYLSHYPDGLAGTTALITAKATDKGVPRRSATSTIAITFGTTTTSTTTTPSTTSQSTSSTTTTTTVAPTPAPFDFWSRPENVAMFSILMLLLLLALLAALWFCLRYCFPGSLGGGLRECCGSCFGRCCGPGACSGFAERCRSCDCDCDCCRPVTVRPQLVRAIDYQEDFWRRNDHYESGKPLF